MKQLILILLDLKYLCQSPSLKKKEIIYFGRCISSLKMVLMSDRRVPLHHHHRQVTGRLAGGGQSVVGEPRTRRAQAVPLPLGLHLLPCLHSEASNSCFSGRAVGNSNESCRSKACVNGIPLGTSEESDILKSYYYIMVKSWDSGVMIAGGKRQILFLGRLLWEETIYRSLSDNSWAVFVVPSASLRLGCLMIHVKVVMLRISSQLPELPSAL